MDFSNHPDLEGVPSPGENEPFAYDSGLLGDIFELNIDRDDTVWRYTTLEKFEQIVEEGHASRQGGLHFVEIDWMRQHDQYEGTFPAPYLRERIEVQKNAYLHHWDEELTEEEAEQKALEEVDRKYSNEEPGPYQKLAQATYADFWSYTDEDQDPLWEMYTNRRTGIAIKSTWGDLLDSFVDWPGLLMARPVEYIDYNRHNPLGSAIGHFFWKRRQHKAENEVRLVLTMNNSLFTSPSELFGIPEPNPDAKNGFLSIAQVDLDQLINKIMIHPRLGDAGKTSQYDVEYTGDKDIELSRDDINITMDVDLEDLRERINQALTDAGLDPDTIPVEKSSI